MEFNHLMGIANTEESQNTVSRIAVRAVIRKEGKLLMVMNNKGDIKLPGGGVNLNESLEEALRREIREETGYTVSTINKKIGTVLERRKDLFDEQTIFEMKSYYYQCSVKDEAQKQSLDEYEKEMEFTPIWVTISEAIKQNQLVVEKSNRNAWVDRELYVLNQLHSFYSSEKSDE